MASRLTFEKEEEETPIWSPDGLADCLCRFAQSESGCIAHCVPLRIGARTDHRDAGSRMHHLHSWSPDGKDHAFLCFAERRSDMISGLRRQTAAHLRASSFSGPFSKARSAFHRTGSGYHTPRTKRDAAKFTSPRFRTRWQASDIEHGWAKRRMVAQWRELYYRDRNHIMAVTLQPGPQMKVSVPHPTSTLRTMLRLPRRRTAASIALAHRFWRRTPPTSMWC